MNSKIKIKLIIFLIILNYILQLPLLTKGQGVAINTNGNAADTSAMLDVSSTIKGTLITRMTTTQRNAISLPAKGLIIYNLDCNNINYNAGTPSAPNWVSLNGINLIATPGSITGSSTVCANQTGITYSISAVNGASSYNWSLPTGASITAASNPATNITVTFGTYSGNVCVVAFDSCSTSNSNCQAVTITPNVNAPVFTLGATSTRCQGAGTVPYSATAVNTTGITYSLDVYSIGGGNTINASTGDVTYTAGWSGTSTITASATGCNGPSTATHIVTVNTNPTATALSNSPICAGNNLNLTSGGGTSYNWSGPNSYTSALQNPTISNATTAAVGTYTVTVSGTGGCTSTAQTAVTVNPIPNVAPSSVTQTICHGAAPAITLTSNITGTTFEWTVAQSGVTGASSGSGSSIAQTLTYSASPGTATYTITPTASMCIGTSTNVIITVAAPCGTAGCYTGTCSGSGVCNYYTDDAKHNCNTCYACNASGNCTARTVDGSLATSLGCSAGDEGCRTCSSGSCTYYASGQHGCSTSYTCNTSGACTTSYICYWTGNNYYGDCATWCVNNGHGTCSSAYCHVYNTCNSPGGGGCNYTGAQCFGDDGLKCLCTN